MTVMATYVGYPDSNNAATQTATTAEWNSLVAAMGQTPTKMLSYIDQRRPIGNWPGDQNWAVSSWKASPWLAGVTPVMGVPMAIVGDNADADFKAIISGTWDQGLTGVWSDWANAGYHSFDIRPGWEMNGTWMPWSVTPENATDFSAAFQHIATLAHSFPGAAINVIWNPNVGQPGAAVPYASYYPGDAFVDTIGIDIYGQPYSTDSSPNGVSTGPADFELSTAIAFAQAHNKPFAIPETGAIDAAFPANLAAAISASGAVVSMVGLWDALDPNVPDLRWSDNPTLAAAWKSTFATISGGGDPPPSPPPSPDTVPVSIILTATRNQAHPSFTASIDGTPITNATRVNGTKTFTFQEMLAPGAHTLDITYATATGKNTGFLNVNQVTVGGTSYLTSPNELALHSKLDIVVNL